MDGDYVVGTQSTCARPPARKIFVSLLTLACVTMATGCGSMQSWYHNGFKVGPEYRRPAVHVEDQWIDSDHPDVHTDTRLDTAWWSVFSDPVLDQLISTAYQENLPLRVAALRVLEARAQRAIASGNLFPQRQQAFGSYARNQRSRNTQPRFGGLMPRAWDQWATGLDATWEFDVWGRFRRAIQATDAELNANIEDYDAILVTLIGDVASTYVEIRSLDERLGLARENVTVQEGSLAVAESRFRNGRVSELDVDQARTNVEATRALIPELEKQRRKAQNRLAVLLGMPPADLTELLGGPGQIPVAPAEIVVGVPADLVRQRPDVRRAERKVAAQSERIGIAMTDLYPMFSVNGSISVGAENLSELFTGASTTGLVTPNLRWNILNYGRIQNNVRVQDARFQQLAVAYDNSVLQACRETEDAIVEFLKSKERLQHLEASVDAANRSVKTVQAQYRAGGADFGRVFVLEAVLVTQQEKMVEARRDVALGLVRVYKALGGGWQIRTTPTAPVASVENGP